MKKIKAIFLMTLFLITSNLFGMEKNYPCEELLLAGLETVIQDCLDEIAHRRLYKTGKNEDYIIPDIQGDYPNTYRDYPIAKIHKEKDVFNWGYGCSVWTKENVSDLLARRENPNQCCFGGRTPLHFVSTWGEEGKDLARRLLAAGANPNIFDAHGNTCLHDAIFNGNDDVEWIDILVEGGALIHLKNRFGENILHIAIQLYKSYIVNHLLCNYGYEIFNYKNFFGHSLLGETPLEYAKSEFFKTSFNQLSKRRRLELIYNMLFEASSLLGNF